MAPLGSSRPSLAYTDQTLEALLPAITPCLNFRFRPLPVIQNPDYVPVDKFTALAEFDGGVVPEFANRSQWNQLNCVLVLGRIVLASVAKRSGA